MMDQLLNFFIPAAHADVPSAAPQGGGLSFIMMFVVFFIFIYFFVWRPQNKRASEAQNMISALQKGDEVVTACGMLGRITKITDQYILISANESTELTFQKSAIATVLPKGTLKAIN